MENIPDTHHRRSIRLKGYDYSQDGLYFITICCANHICRFGTISTVHDRAGASPVPTNGEMSKMVLNEFGQIARVEWEKLPKRFLNMEMDVFQIMPNHMHAIIALNNLVGAGLAPAHDINKSNSLDVWAGASPAPTISMIVGSYKSLVANECLKIYKSRNEIMGKFWQRNYFEHIIRSETALYYITEYIINNPVNWNKDELYRDFPDCR